jgi:hypothetical protein
MTPLLGPTASLAASLTVQIGYCVSLMASLLLYMHPLRTSLAEMIWSEEGEQSAPVDRSTAAADASAVGDGGSSRAAGSGEKVAAMEHQHYYVLTYGMLAAATLAAISVPGEWLIESSGGVGWGGVLLLWLADG